MNKKVKELVLTNTGLLLAIISALLYAFNVVIEKYYISYISSEMILFLMYFGAGFGLFSIYLFTRNKNKNKDNKLTSKETPLIVLIVVCELLASFLTIEAVKRVDASLVSLLSVFEIIMTAICAYFIFKDPIEKNEIVSIILMVIGCIVLNFKVGIFTNISFSSLLVILGCLCWGIENNVTAMISAKEPALFTAIKCGMVALLYLIIVLLRGTFNISYPTLIFLGFFSYGLSILAYAVSTKYLGANRATLVFSFSPIFGVLLALIFYKEHITITFLISMVIMIAAIVSINTKNK